MHILQALVLELPYGGDVFASSPCYSVLSRNYKFTRQRERLIESSELVRDHINAISPSQCFHLRKHRRSHLFFRLLFPLYTIHFILKGLKAFLISPQICLTVLEDKFPSNLMVTSVFPDSKVQVLARLDQLVLDL